MTSTLNPRFTFDTYVVGAANRLAVTAGRTVAENPGSAYNPLFIYSGSGLGKTHLLMAVGHATKAIAPQLNIEYLTLDEYVEAFHAAIAAGQGDAFRRRFQNVDALLVDDVQFLTNRKEMQTELMRLTEALQQAGHQIVLASDRPPAEISDLDERLISRFSGGLVVDMGVPDYETRVAILRRKAEERGSSFQPGVLEVVAKVEFPNVRELMGALNRLVAYQAVNDTPINAEAARQVLGVAGTGDEGRGTGSAVPAATPARPGSGGPDEFSQFLSDVTVTVGKAVEAWRARVAEAVLRWEGEGYRTARLEKLLDQDTPAAVDEAIAAYVKDVERLKALEAEVGTLDPQAAGGKVFHDPDRLDEAEAAAAKVREGAAPPPGPSAAFPFDTYAAGPSNEVAVSAARAVISSPGKKYNPLVLAGHSGLGKTHLLNAIGLELAKKKGAIVACLSTQAFVDELIAAIDGNRVDWWRARYRRATALLLDDIHLLAGKERTQEELFNLFNQFLDADRQLIFTVPAHPNTLKGLEERIVSRLEGGLVAEMGEPDRELRRAALERLLQQNRVATDPALLDYLADRPIDSVRSLTGLVQRVVEAAAAQDAPVSAGLARDVLEGAPPPGARRTTGLRTSGLVVSSAGGVRSREKMVWDWPAASDRVIEELR
jgi:chromosomal replication initiator protein DnaA